MPKDQDTPTVVVPKTSEPSVKIAIKNYERTVERFKQALHWKRFGTVGMDQYLKVVVNEDQRFTLKPPKPVLDEDT